MSSWILNTSLNLKEVVFARLTDQKVLEILATLRKTKLVFTDSKLTIETLEQCVKRVQI